MEFQEFNAPVKYGATIGYPLSTSVGGDMAADSDGSIWIGAQGIPFCVAKAFGTTALVAGVTVMADSVVTNDRCVYVSDFFIRSGATAGTESGATGSVVNIQCSDGTIYAKFYWSGMAADSVLLKSSGSFTVMGAMYNGTGGSAGKGIQIKLASGSVSAGSDGTIVIYGVIK